MQTTQNYGLKKPEGTDVVNIEDINGNMDTIDRVIQKAVSRRTLTLTASGWSASYPFTQEVTVSGVTVDDDIKIIGVFVPAGATKEQAKALTKAAGYLIYNPDGVEAGKVTFKAYKKPTVDIQVITEGA